MNNTVVSGHQPVYLPWLGFFHKAAICDIFIYMDDVQYLSQDWNNRNKIITNSGVSMWLTVPVDLKNSTSLMLRDIKIKREDCKESNRWNHKHWNSIRHAYGKAKYFSKFADFFEWLYLKNEWETLSSLNLAITKQIFEWLEISPTLIIASDQNFSGRKSNLVLEHGIKFNADLIVTGALGRQYIIAQDFIDAGIGLYHQNYIHPEYRQVAKQFTSHLSIIDLLFNCGGDARDILMSGNISRRELFGDQAQ